MIQSEEKSHLKLSQIKERSQKASRHETISDDTDTETETRDLKFWSRDLKSLVSTWMGDHQIRQVAVTLAL